MTITSLLILTMLHTIMFTKHLLYIFIFFCGSTLLAQNFEQVDKIALSYTKQFSSPEKLADQIAKDFETDIERVRAVYTWIAYYISYDIKESNHPTYSYSSEGERSWRELQYSKKLCKRVITRRRAVCQGYSYLFKAVCTALNIETTIVTGASKTLTKDIGKRYNSNHAWNIVTINNQKHLIDVTWASQRDKNNIKYVDDYYFMTSPQDFILKHYPNNYSHALLDRVVSKQEFLNAPLLHSYDSSKFKLIQPQEGILSKGSTIVFTLEVAQPVTWVQIEIGEKQFEIKNYTYLNKRLLFDFNIPKDIRARDILLYINGNPIVSYALK